MTFWSHSDAYNYGMQDDDDSNSSDPASSSSDDEIDIILRGTPEQKRKLKRLQHRIDGSNQRKKNASSSEDEFEKEMNAELAQRVDFMEKSRDPTGNNVLMGPSTSVLQEEEKDLFYDNIYFDSDEEEKDDGAVGAQDTSRHAVISNDDLLYDPTMDDKDQRWVDRQRRRNNNSHLQNLLSSTQNKRKKLAKLPSSDALLDCPACMTTLCLDCQRHDTYKHQYRAMFVMNCEVDNSQMLECPDQQKKRKKKKSTSAESSCAAPPPATTAVPTNTTSGSDLFHPIKCTECNTVVGVIDSDEVYHFFNVLASHT